MFYESSLCDRYLDNLKEELKKYSSFCFDSIYIGGGTPTSLNISQLERLFNMLLPYQSDNSFITIETNPDLDSNKIELLSKFNVNRISIGIQTFDKEYLKLINRSNDYSKVCELINVLKKNNINDINVDLIYGFNNQTVERLDKDLDLFLKLDINHISTYALQVEEMTMLYNKKYQTLDDDNESKLYEHIVNRLKENNIYRYEVSNFARKGFESKHNLIYWNNNEYGGCGLHASSYIDGVRRTNTKSLTKYLKGEYQDYEEILTVEDEKFYFIMLSLRKIEGVSLKVYKNKYNEDFYLAKKNIVDALINDELLEIKDGYLKITSDNYFIMDFILKKLLF